VDEIPPEMLWLPIGRRGCRAHRGASSTELLDKICLCQINMLICCQSPGPLQYDREACSDLWTQLLPSLLMDITEEAMQDAATTAFLYERDSGDEIISDMA